MQEVPEIIDNFRRFWYFLGAGNTTFNPKSHLEPVAGLEQSLVVGEGGEPGGAGHPVPRGVLQAQDPLLLLVLKVPDGVTRCCFCYQVTFYKW